jgi:hypothetical protein
MQTEYSLVSFEEMKSKDQNFSLYTKAEKNRLIVKAIKNMICHITPWHMSCEHRRKPVALVATA